MNDHQENHVERLGIAERLLEAIRDGIDAARYFARHEAVSGMTNEEDELVELANAVETAASELDEAMMALLEHQSGDQTDGNGDAN